uniref:shootin-1-like isoform X1 n=1 Tax=Podarcis muralis TaxID=64176 RepID=UPI00109F1760|nr:shootin-1-like isoform X1 [Podarcis muralis]
MEPLVEDLSQLAAILESHSDSDSEKDEEDEEAAACQERDEAKKKLAEFEYASQALLAELSTLEAEYEIEKSCREQAEAYAAQVSRENKKLKRISAALLPMLTHLPADLIDPGNEEEIPTEEVLDPVGQYLQQIKDLQAKVSLLLDEKKELAVQVTELQGRVQQLQEQVEEEQFEKQSLQALVAERQRALKRVKRVSQLLTEEYGKVSQQLDLEEELRQQAETFARQMLVKQKEANRQSMILMQNIGPETQLLQAMEEVAKMTRELEEARQEHQAKVKDLEAQLLGRPQAEELHRLLAALAAAEEEKVRLGERLLRAEERNAALEERVRSLEEEAKAIGTPSPKTCPEAPLPPLPPPPPPPPPPLPPACHVPVDPLIALRQRKGRQQAKCAANSCTDDVKSKAVEEMMARIKSGVVLRPARKDAGDFSKAAAVSKRRSTTMELKGLLAQSGTRSPVRRSSRRQGSQRKLTDNQLESILQRRRQMVDCPAQGQVPQLQPVIITKHITSVGVWEAVAGVVSAADPHPSTMSSGDLGKSPTGDPGNLEATIPPCSEEEPGPAQSQLRVAPLQMSRRLVLASGSRDPP